MVYECLVRTFECLSLESGSLDKPVQEGFVIFGKMTLGEKISKVEELANILQVCVYAGAKKILLLAPSTGDFFKVPADLMSKSNRFSIYIR